MTLDAIMAVFRGSDAGATRALYARLGEMPPRGPVAVKLLQACKASQRAKLYARGSYRRAAYDKKDWAIGELCRALVGAPDVVPSWGWGRDPKAVGFENIIYVDVPGAGQISFHTEHRRDGPDYAGLWDRAIDQAPGRICRWAEAVLDGREVFNGEQGGDDGSRQRGVEGGTAADAGEEQAGAAEPDQGWQQQAFNL